MRFLDRRRVLSNMRLAVTHLTGTSVSDSHLKRAFIDAMNGAQSTCIESQSDDLYLEFDNPELVARLVERTVFSEREVAGQAYRLNSEERAHFFKTFEAAKDLLARAVPGLYHLLTQVIGSVAAYKIPERDGGSVSCCIGLIWLSPRTEWTDTHCAEMLVHEFIHNSVFLEDMVRGIMPTPSLLEDDDALTVSAIRRTRRPYDKAFHSACVATGIMYYHASIGRAADAEIHFDALRRTVLDLGDRDRALRARGQDLLTENGRQLLDELRQFVNGGPNYQLLTDALTVH
jgi:HEXXH motif-containing protein